MREIKLDNRLSTIAGLIRKNKIVLDVGTDHALLPCYLKQHGWKNVIASDININPLKSAQSTINEHGADIRLVQSDGLKNIDYAEDIVIAGMGGETIAEIVKNCAFKNDDTSFVLQPMTRHAELRRSLYLTGYEILSEVAAKTDGKIYTIMLVKYCGKVRIIDDLTAFLGKQKNREYIVAQIKKVNKIRNSKPEYSELIPQMEAVLNAINS